LELQGILKMAYNLKTPKEKKEKDNLYSVPKGLTEDENKFYNDEYHEELVNDKYGVRKRESSIEPEQEDIFAVPKGLDEEKSEDLFSMKSTEQEHIDEINADLYAEDSPIKVKNKNTLLIEADGRTHEVSKNDLVEYHKQYRLDGIDGHDIQGFRNLGSIKGDYQAIDRIYKDSNVIFNKIDSHSGGYKTIPSEDDE
jgi:hypothetical protein